MGFANTEVAITGTPNVTIDTTDGPVSVEATISGQVQAEISAGTVQVENVDGGVLVSQSTAPQQNLTAGGVAGSETSVTVDLPTNCESIAVLIPTAYSGSVTVKGVTTGMSYPVGSVGAVAGSDTYDVALVFPAVDSQVTVELSVAPGVAWWVTSDSVVRYTFGTAVGGGIPLVEGIRDYSAQRVWYSDVTSQTFDAGPLEVKAGDTLIVALVVNASLSAGAITLSDTLGSTWKQVVSLSAGVAPVTTAMVWTAVAQQSGSAVVAITFDSTTSQTFNAAWFAWSVAASNQPTAYNSATATTASDVAVTLGLSSAPSLVVAVAGGNLPIIGASQDSDGSYAPTMLLGAIDDTGIGVTCFAAGFVSWHTGGGTIDANFTFYGQTGSEQNTVAAVAAAFAAS